nr:transcription elongation factor GreA [Desulfobacterales bacterium]
MERVPITQDGYESLKEELKHLKAVERPKVIKAIEEARAHGDVSENAEYDAAKERQAQITRRINELEYKIASSEVINTSDLNTDRAFFGCTVVLENMDTEEIVRYQLVGPYESDIKKGRISISSPLGRGIIGKKKGDEITVQVPGGLRRYEVVDILATP